MEVAEVVEDPSITLIQKISSITWKTRCVNARDANEENLKKRMDAGGPGGGVGCGGCGGQGGRGRCRQTSAPTIQMSSWPEHYKPPYYYASKKLGTPIDTVLYIIDLNTTPLFSKYSLP